MQLVSYIFPKGTKTLHIGREKKKDIDETALFSLSMQTLIKIVQ